MPEARRIALFGGTFDPVHLGHVHMAALAKEAANLDEVRFLPCRISPHKTERIPASGEDRLAMLRLATKDLSWATVDDYELNGPEPSYSYATAEAMAGREPGVQWFWLMGGDQWESLTLWKNPEQLAAIVTFLVLARAGTPSPEPRSGFRMIVVEGDHPASSTAIRTGTGQEWMPPGVAEYVAFYSLYQGGSSACTPGDT